MANNDLRKMHADCIENYLSRNRYDIGDAMRNALEDAIECLREDSVNKADVLYKIKHLINYSLAHNEPLQVVLALVTLEDMIR